MKKLSLTLFTLLIVAFTTTMSFAQKLKPIAQMVHSQMDNTNVPTTKLFKALDAQQNQSFINQKVLTKGTILKLDFTALKQAVESNTNTMSLEIPYDGDKITIDMVQAPNFSPDFVLKTSDSNEKPVPYEKGRYYRGIIRGMDESVAAITLFKDEIVGVISSPVHHNLNLGKLEGNDARKEDYIIYSDRDVKNKPNFDCQSENTELQGKSNFGVGNGVESAAMMVGGCVRVYFELDHGTYLNRGSSTTAAVNYITACFNNVATLYANESISTVISEIFVWTTPDGYPTTSSAALNSFTTTRTTFNGDLAHLVSIRSGPSFSGIAWLFNGSPFTVLCSSNKYAYSQTSASFNNLPAYSWTIEVLTHEMGHNMGSPHTHSCTWPGGAIDGCATVEGSCAQPALPAAGSGTIMSYCHQQATVGINFANGFGTLPGGRIRTAITLVSCLNPTCTTTTCAAPTTPSVSSITASGGTVSWAAVTGAVNYKVEYKLSSSSTWITANAAVAGTSLALTGLSPSSTYNVQVTTNCASGSSVASPSATFTTTAGITCTAPTTPSVSSITSSGGTVSWAAVSGAVSYKVEYKLSSTATWLLANAAVAGTSFNLTGLSAGTTYNVQISTNCTGASSTPSPMATFVTTAAGCSAPSLPNILSPSNNSVSISWGSVAGAISYKIEYKPASSSTWIVANAANVGTFYFLSGLASGTSYNVRVSTNCAGLTSVPSAIATFSTTGGAPVCNAPSTPSISSVTTNSATVTWGAVSGAVSYKVEYKLGSSSTWITANAAVVGTSFSLTGLLPGSTYNVQVTTNCASSSSSPSPTATFTAASTPTCSAPSTPTISSVTTNSATVTWGAVSGAVSYKVEFKLASSSTWTTANAAVAGTSFNLTGLSTSSTYNVQVTTNCASLTSSPSSTATFTTGSLTCSAPATPSISNITTNSAIATWSAVSGAVSYKVEYKLSSSGTWITANAAVAGTSFTLTGLTSSSTYNVQITTNCASSSSAASPSATFMTAAASSCSAPSTPNTISPSTSTVSISWGAVTGAISYKVEYKPASSSTWITANAAQIGTFYFLSGLASGTTYNVQISTNCSGSTSAPSGIATFSTTGGAPVCNAPSTPTIGSITTTGGTVSWSAVSGAVSYKVEYKQSSAATWIVANAAVVGTSFTLTGLASGITYNVQVTTNCAVNSSSPSPTATFTTTASSGCSDANEPNNSTGTAKVIMPNSIVSGGIDIATDNDYYTFTTTSQSPNIAVFLTQIAADIQLELYNSSSVLLASSTRSGVNNESVTFGTAAAGTYYIRIFGNVTSTCYQLTLLTDKTAFSCAAAPAPLGSASDNSKTVGNATFDKMKLFVFPNPSKNMANLRILAYEQGEYDMIVYDMVGKQILTNKVKLGEGENLHQLNTTMLNKGTYLVRVFKDNQSVVQKFVVD